MPCFSPTSPPHRMKSRWRMPIEYQVGTVGPRFLQAQMPPEWTRVCWRTVALIAVGCGDVPSKGGTTMSLCGEKHHLPLRSGRSISVAVVFMYAGGTPFAADLITE